MKKIAILLIFLLLLNGCSNEDKSDSSENINEQTIKGRVILPNGNNIDANQLSIQSSIDNSSISSDEYSINIPKENHNFTFVTDKNEKVILMGYNYPNQTNFDLNAESTVIALAMSLPITSSMTDDAKINFVSKLKQSLSFQSVVINMEQLIIQGISPLDLNQTTFLNNFLKMFENSLSNKSSNLEEDYNRKPVNIITAGNKITFQNAGKLYETSIGIYKDDQRIEHIELDRIQFFANSASEAFSTANNITTNDIGSIDIIQKTYEFKNDGEYKIKIKTGFGTDLSYESNEARFDNISKWSMDFLFTFLPLKELSKPECTQTMLSEIRTYTVVALEGKSINTLADAIATSYDISKSVVDLVGANVQCFAMNSENIKFLTLIKKVFGWTALVSRTGTLGNVSLGMSQWIYDNSSMDLCYNVNGNAISNCYPITLKSINISNTGPYKNGNSICYGGPLNIYYLNFNYTDDDNLILNSLSNIILGYNFENNGCIAPWSTENSNNYFSNYPVTFNSSSISVPFGISLGSNNSNWVDLSIHFIDLNSKEQISNKINFRVQRNINYP